MISRCRTGIWILTVLLISCGKGSDSQTPTEIPQKESISNSVEATVTEDNLRVRRLPYLDQEVLGHLMAGDSVAVESRTAWTEDIGDTRAPWFLIDSSGLSGWTYGGYLDFPAGDVGAVIADAALAPPKAKLVKSSPSDSLDPQELPELLLPVFGMEAEIDISQPREGDITYDSINEYLIIPYGLKIKSPLKSLLEGINSSVFHIVAESPGGLHFENTLDAGNLKRLSETSSSLPPGFPSGADAFLIPFFHLATLEEGSWEFYAFIGEEDWPVAVGKVDIRPSDASIVKNPSPDPFRDSPRSTFARGDKAYVFGRFSQRTAELQVALYHDTKEYQSGKTLLIPVAAKQCETNTSGVWSTTINIDNRIPEGKSWIAVGNPIESADHLLLFMTHLQL